MKIVHLVWHCLLGFSMAAAPTEAILRIGSVSYTQSELLKRPEIQ